MRSTTTPANAISSASTPGVYAVVERSARMMGTEVSVQIAAAPAERPAAEAAAATCMAWLAEVDERLSRFRPASDLCRLNADAGRWHRASDVLYACVERAIAAARASGGLFDPTLLPRLEALGYDRDFALIAHRETLPAEHDDPNEPATGLPPTAAWAAVALDPASRRIRLPWGVRLDLGGIAKGWAADIAVERYCSGFDSALVNVGGDLRLRGGPAPGQAWSVGIRDPLAEVEGRTTHDIATVAFSRGALATSGAAQRWWLRRGLRAHHLLDPRTGLPAAVWSGEDRAHGRSGEPLIATATALAPTAARAEVAAKLALLRGYPAALSAVEAAWESEGPLGADGDADSAVALLLVLATGEVAVSANMGAYIASWGTERAPLPLLPGAAGVSAGYAEAPALKWNETP